MFNLSPSKLGLKDSTSYNSEEAATSDYFNGALSHWLLSVSSEITTKCLSEKERASGVYAEHNINALLWADASTRSQIGIAGITNGVYSPNEVRSWNNDDGYDGGDQFYMPMNIQPVNSVGVDQSQVGRAILQECFTRAINRICIKADRKKGNPVAEDIDGIIAIVLTASEGFGRSHGVDGRAVVSDWIDSLKALSLEELKLASVRLSKEAIDKILGVDE